MKFAYNFLCGQFSKIAYIVLFCASCGFCGQSIAMDSWKATIESAVQKNASTSFSAKIGSLSGDNFPTIQSEGDNGQNPILITMPKNAKTCYYYLLKDGDMYCSNKPFSSSQRIAIDQTETALRIAELVKSTYSFPLKITELINELDAIDYTDLGDVTITGIQCRGHQIEFYGGPEEMEKIRTALWSKDFPLDELKKYQPSDPYFLVPSKYDFFIGKKDGFLYGWKSYLSSGNVVEMFFMNVILNPDSPPGTFALPEDCEIETIDDEEELEIFFKTQRTSLSKRITTKTLRFFSTNGVYVVLGLSLLLISAAVMIRKVRNAR